MNIEDLLPKVIDITIKKRIAWSDPEDDIFTTRVGDKKFQISMGFDDDAGESFYRFNIYSGGDASPFTGQLIDTMYANRFRGPFTDLEELYTAARRNALGLDKVISDIDAELDKLLK